MILAISGAFYRLLRDKEELRTVRRACILLVIPIFLGRILVPFVAIENPFTPHEFASLMDTNFLYKGTITYYRKTGFLLYASWKSEFGEFSGDSNFLSVSSNEINVCSTFMGPDKVYEMENSHIDLRGKAIDEFLLCNHSWTECFKLTRDRLHYSRSNEGEVSCPLSESEYRQLRRELERMELAPRHASGPEAFDLDIYTLSVSRTNDESGYYSYVNGEKQFQFLYDFIYQASLEGRL